MRLAPTRKLVADYGALLGAERVRREREFERRLAQIYDKVLTSMKESGVYGVEEIIERHRKGKQSQLRRLLGQGMRNPGARVLEPGRVKQRRQTSGRSQQAKQAGKRTNRQAPSAKPKALRQATTRPPTKKCKDGPQWKPRRGCQCARCQAAARRQKALKGLRAVTKIEPLPRGRAKFVR